MAAQGLTLSLRLRALLALLACVRPLWRWALTQRIRDGKESPESRAQKLMLDEPDQPPAGVPLIWGHAVGVGEVLALLGLFRRLVALMPDHHFLLTSTSLTSGQALVRQQLPAQIHHRFAPVDHPQVMAQFLARFQPNAACWSEMDLWPHMLLATRERGIPMLLLNARLNAEKATRRRRQAWFYRPLLACFSRIYAQNPASQALLHSLDLHTVAPLSGNIKALAPAQTVDAAEHRLWQNLLADRPVWLLASSHSGEEAIALQAHQALRAQHPRALLLIVPRDASRGAEIAALAAEQGMQVALRSVDEALQSVHSVYVANTMGELGLWYALCPVALVGGSLVPIGGHNPYEALAAGCAVLSGPQIHNFSESYEDLVATGLARVVHNADDVTSAVVDTWARGSEAVSAAASESPDSAHELSALLQDIVQTLQTPLKA